MSVHDLVLNKFKRAPKRAPPIATKTQPKYSAVSVHGSPDIYPLISVHPGHPDITALYINGVIPLTETTPMTRNKAAELLSLQKTLQKALKDRAEHFIIDGVILTREQALELNNYELNELSDKLHSL